MARILFVDDDPFTLETLSKAVEVFGHQALTAHNGEEGLAMATGQTPDLIFTDIRLPDMDGLQLVSKLKGVPLIAQIPVLVLSASPELDAADLAKAAGAADYLNKPVRLQALLNIIATYTKPAAS
jgi:CheY-like chemotaxis protein